MVNRPLYVPLLVLAVLALGVSCATYTYNDAQSHIPPVESVPFETPVSTHMVIEPKESTPAEVKSIVDTGPSAEMVALGDETEALVFQDTVSPAEPEMPDRTSLWMCSLRLIPHTCPPSREITFPYHYIPHEATTITDSRIHQFSAVLIPLPIIGEEETDIAIKEIATGIRDLNASVILITGNVETTAFLMRELEQNGVLFADGGAILTSLPITDISKQSVILEPAAGSFFQIAIANIQKPSPLDAFIENHADEAEWRSAVEAMHDERQDGLQSFLSQLDALPTLLGASLAEPSDLDWTSFTPISYRSPYAWPMSALIEENGFSDSYRSTHYSEETDLGTTWRMAAGDMVFAERTDYLYVRSLLPVETTVVDLGSISAAKSEKPARFGVFGTYILP